LKDGLPIKIIGDQISPFWLYRPVVMLTLLPLLIHTFWIIRNYATRFDWSPGCTKKALIQKQSVAQFVRISGLEFTPSYPCMSPIIACLQGFLAHSIRNIIGQTTVGSECRKEIASDTKQRTEKRIVAVAEQEQVDSCVPLFGILTPCFDPAVDVGPMLLLA
jgi:hypothetical protein